MNITKMKCFTITITIIKIQSVKFILTKDTGPVVSFSS